MRSAVANSGLLGSVSTGIWCWLDDDLALVRSWGFRLDEISVPVSVWHGLEDRFEVVKGVRGVGLLQGLELHQEIAVDVVGAGIQLGVLLNPVRPDVVRMMPALTITEEEVDRGVDLLEAALQEATRH